MINPKYVNKAQISHGCRAYRATNQSNVPNNNDTLVLWTDTDFDYNNEMDKVTNVGRFTPTEPGVYFVSASVEFAANTTGVRWCRVYKNDTVEVHGAVHNAAATGASDCVVVGFVEMNGTTDYIEIWMYQNSGGNLNMFGTRTVSHVCIALWPF